MSDDLLASIKMLVNEGKGDPRRIRKIILKLDDGKNLDEGDKEYIYMLTSEHVGDLSDADKNEIEKIKDHLDSDDQVLIVAKQSKFKPGGAVLAGGNTIFATNKKIIIRNPTMLGLRESVEEIAYDQITSVKLDKGMFSASIIIRSPGLSELSRLSSASGLIAWGRGEEGQIDAIPKDKAEKIVRIIKEKMEEIRKAKQTQPTQSQTTSISDEIMKLAKLKEQGVISEKEFSKMKQELIKKM